MTGDEPNRPAPDASPSSEGELSERLNRLGRSLDERKPGPASGPTMREPSRAETQGIAQALRLSTEFVAGVAAGAILGWIVDHYLGTRPWGLIVLLMLGFAAGILNVMRAAGMLGTPGATPKGTSGGA